MSIKPDGSVPDRVLNGVSLAVQSPNDLAEFSVFNFGMGARQVGNAFHLTYSVSAAASILPLVTASQPSVGSAPDWYWKIGITLSDLDYACRDLLAKGVAVSSPSSLWISAMWRILAILRDFRSNYFSIGSKGGKV